MTARDLIERSLRLIGVVASGETMTADEANDGLTTLNYLIQSWATQGLTMHAVTRVTEPIIASQAYYTLGSGGNIDRAWVRRIERASIVFSSTTPDTETPITCYSDQTWANIAAKDMTSTVPQGIYYDATYPLGKVYPWPVATDATVSLVLYIPEPIVTLTALTTTLSVPPGYEGALAYNLAVWLAPEYERQIDPVVMKLANDTLADIKRQNKRPAILYVDAALRFGGSSYNIKTDDIT